MLVIGSLVLLAVTILAENLNYKSYKVYQVYPSGKEQVQILAALSNNPLFDFLSPVRHDENPVDIMVEPSTQAAFEKFLENSGVKFDVLSDNVERVLQEEQLMPLLTSRTQQVNISFTTYHRHDEINDYLDQLAKDYANIASVENIGKSYEGRDLKLIKISTNSSAHKPVIFIDAGIHAREWIAPPVALYTISQLTEHPENAGLLEKVDWHVLPVVNPDGYAYTQQNLLQRLWRKTRSIGTNCTGTDANRNFGFHWGETGSSSNECYEDYHGTHAFSEPETAAIRDYIFAVKDRIKLYLTFHSFGQLILYPWGYTSELPEDGDELQTLGEMVASSIRSVSSTNYTVGSSTNVLYAAAGGSDDWAKGVAGIALSYTIELPKGGLIGFSPLPNRILPICMETWEGIKTYHQYISEKFGK